jgi:hypothetical protein
VNIKYTVGDETTPREWSGGDADEFISRVSVFDSQCAAVYLNEKTDVAFLPLGLDLFDKLVQACRAVRTRLESEQRALNTNVLAPIVAQMPPGTAAAKLAGNVTSLPEPEAVRAVTRLSTDEEAGLGFIEPCNGHTQRSIDSKRCNGIAVTRIWAGAVPAGAPALDTF